MVNQEFKPIEGLVYGQTNKAWYTIIHPKSREELAKELKEEWENKLTFLDRLREEKEIARIVDKIDNHPFVTEIEDGTLPIEKWKTYIIQNQAYISRIVKTWPSGVAPAIGRKNAKRMFALSQQIPFDVSEHSFWQMALDAGFTNEQLRAAEEDPDVAFPAGRAYADFMAAEWATGHSAAAIASYIACPWTYTRREIGGLDLTERVFKGLVKHYGVNKKWAYQFIYEEGYAEWHDVHVKIGKEIVNEAYESGDKNLIHTIRSNFKRNCEQEFMFWNAPYKHDPSKEREIGSYY